MNLAPPKDDGNKRKTRSRTGCLNCRRKKKKCDEKKPTCTICSKASEKCEWTRGLTFRLENAFTLDENSQSISMSRANRSKRRRQSPPEQTKSQNDTTAAEDNSPVQGDSSSNNVSASPSTDSFGLINSQFDPSTTTESAEFQNELRDEQGAEVAIDGMDFYPSPEFGSDDGIFLSGSKYRELHNTLRRNVFMTARSRQPSRQGSPSLIGLEGTHNDNHDMQIVENGIEDNAPVIQTQISPEVETLLSPNQEHILWKNWVEEISLWLDKFDSHKHFRHTLPNMAQNCPHLRYSMLALSARQLERKDGSLPASTSLALYQEAIHRLVPQLHERTVLVVASCVVLCVLEMLSCSPRAWRRHLDGCASLIRSMNIRGDSGGVEQALFWCFARMDVCGGLISMERTLIPIDEWMSANSFEADCTYFQITGVFEDHANYSCYLIGKVIDFLYGPEDPKTPNSLNGSVQGSFASQWCELFDQLEHWYIVRPPEMQAFLYQNSTSAQDKTGSPFPTALFTNGAAISGNQLHHTASLLMLQNCPRNTKRTRSLLWHARQICAISISNTHHGCWTNCIQPLWLAGQVMSHPDEHRAITNIYKRIELETGWAATWRAVDLQQHWGDLDN
ncbi:hypothetical protein BU24DRAFT_418775 [Aaosphaeria arxii CBS 175.79]|uniref:Zn(2)-C6 fungal-type domain-containing protein n=1 Tax=Aaosphaeria arxii CBS 175.79 TaxID=1450172 RepID=A0A6A5Y0W1_9PLEO|nr:uncharacterized protein BU24DRAFT_418775 [Aaosphaeria arxii CBS 175.79]KAF2019168.1 hypothetical protein BU24DRAFT_418775 [Aaosphaeria arxii CBS 175.79]